MCIFFVWGTALLSICSVLRFANIGGISKVRRCASELISHIGRDVRLTNPMQTFLLAILYVCYLSHSEARRDAQLTKHMILYIND